MAKIGRVYIGKELDNQHVPFGAKVGRISKRNVAGIKQAYDSSKKTTKYIIIGGLVIGCLAKPVELGNPDYFVPVPRASVSASIDAKVAGSDLDRKQAGIEKEVTRTEKHDDTILISNKEKRVQYWIDHYTSPNQKPGLEESFSRVYSNLNLIKKAYDAFDKDSIGNLELEDIMAQMIIESGGKARAKSRFAKGPMQFRRSTARENGLTIDKYVDERCDVYKSTKAGIEYRKRIENVVDSGEIALACMNYGIGNMRKFIRGNSDFWDIQKGEIPDETYDYVPKILAVKEILKNPEKYGVNIDVKEIPEYAPYEIKKGDTIFGLSKKFDSSPAEILNANPGLKNKNRIIPGMEIYIPVGQHNEAYVKRILKSDA